MAGQNNDKNRKSEAQKILEQADKAGRFAGNDSDAKAARGEATKNVRQDTQSTRTERDNASGLDVNQANDGDASNVRDEATQRIGDTNRASQKANEGARQQRDDVRNDDRDKINNDELGRN